MIRRASAAFLFVTALAIPLFFSPILEALRLATLPGAAGALLLWRGTVRGILLTTPVVFLLSLWSLWLIPLWPLNAWWATLAWGSLAPLLALGTGAALPEVAPHARRVRTLVDPSWGATAASLQRWVATGRDAAAASRIVEKAIGRPVDGAYLPGLAVIVATGEKIGPAERTKALDIALERGLRGWKP